MVHLSIHGVCAEAKNKYFKDIAHNSNYKIVCLTVAKRHQRLLCFYVVSTLFFDRSIECGPGMVN